MSKEDIFRKIKLLVRPLGAFEEKDAMYLVVETYKIKERELNSRRDVMREQFPHLTFFRDWVVHTYLHSNDCVARQNDLNNKEKLLEELLAIYEDQDTKQKLVSMFPSLIRSLDLIVQDQDIIPNQNID